MAVNISVSDLTAATGISAAQATRLLPVGAALIEEYGPAAPVPIQNESLIRLTGYLRQMPSGLRKVGASSLDIEYDVAGLKAPFRQSGAMSLLSPWKRRRAGAIG